jgi:hypothetical protein
MERTGWSYQQVWNGLKKLDDLPRELANRKGWDLSTCRALYAQHGFDPNADLAWGAVVEEATCDECLETFPYVNAHPYDRATGADFGVEPPKYCFRCRQAAGGVGHCLRCDGPVLGRNSDGFCEGCQDFIDGQ